MSNTFYIIYSNFRYLSWSQGFHVRLHSYCYNFRYLSWSTGVSCQIPFILYTVTSDTSPDLRCFVSNTFYIIYSNFRYLSWSQGFRFKYLLYYIQYLEIPLLISGVLCHIPFILYTVTSDTCPDLRCFVSKTFILYTVTSDTCPDLRCFVSNTFYIIYSNFKYLSWSQVFRVKYLYIIYSNFRYLSWSQVFRVKYLLYYIQ